MARDFEETRVRFRPSPVSLLLIGESPPSRGTFFYDGDSQFANHTRTAFDAVFGPTKDEATFLAEFKSQGFYLDDLCHTPVDTLGSTERKRQAGAGVSRIAATIRSERPRAVVIVGKSLEDLVFPAMGETDVPAYTLPFAGNGHQNDYIDGLVAILAELGYLSGDC